VSDDTGQSGAQPSNRTIFTADNLPVLRGIDSETIDLIYLDPPFNTGKQWHAPIGSDAEGASFNDIWAWDDVSEAEGETLATSVKRQWLNALHIESPIRAVVETAEATAGEEMGAYLAFMAMRLVEMQRVLKPTGSIYLHCDPTASHYLKLLMDAIVGRENFRNELIWRRTTGVKGTRGATKTLGSVTDTILFYGKSRSHLIEIPRVREETKGMRQFKHQDKRGTYRAVADLYSDGALHDSPRYEWRGHNPPYGWRVSKANLIKLHEADRIHYNKNGKPFRKQYKDEWDGAPVSSLWVDIPQATRSERTGYPTQKPLALLERIISASSSPGEVVLDPFCGCATACLAAEKLGRQWIGIDVSELAVLLCDDRIQKMQNETGQTNFGIPYHDPIHRTDIPEPTDASAQIDEMPIDPALSKDVVKQRLYEEQDGICNGCERHFTPEFADLMDLDHIKPKVKGGLHTWPNVQLLCRTCNVRKGAGTMAQLRKRLQQDVA
jgi:site-specific DNA-methyltransferase (adenine-specific)